MLTSSSETAEKARPKSSTIPHWASRGASHLTTTSLHGRKAPISRWPPFGGRSPGPETELSPHTPAQHTNLRVWCWRPVLSRYPPPRQGRSSKQDLQSAQRAGGGAPAPHTDFDGVYALPFFLTRRKSWAMTKRASCRRFAAEPIVAYSVGSMAAFERSLQFATSFSAALSRHLRQHHKL